MTLSGQSVFHLAGSERGFTYCERPVLSVAHRISWDAFQARRGRPLPENGRLCKDCLRKRRIVRQEQR
jgi:hypothetical protein